MNTQPLPLFSDALYELRGPRMEPAANFLMDIIKEEIEEKLNDIARDFARQAIIIDEIYQPMFAARFPKADCLTPKDILVFPRSDYDLIISLFYMHRCNHVEAHLQQIYQHLCPDGFFMAGFLGGSTLTELRESFLAAEIDIENGASPRVAPMIDTRTAGMLLQRAGFTLPVADNLKLTAEYASVFSLITDLRKLGLTNIQNAQKKHISRRETLFAMARDYEERNQLENGNVKASYEILFLSGWSPHPDQPRALRPGSATISLETALKNAQKES